MFGYVDSHRRPMLLVTIRHPVSSAFIDIDALIDTGCTTMAILPHALVAQLALPFSHYASGTLASGTSVRFAIYSAAIDWFSSRRAITVAESGVQMPLLGSALLSPHTLIIDYGQRTVEIR